LTIEVVHNINRFWGSTCATCKPSCSSIFGLSNV